MVSQRSSQRPVVESPPEEGVDKLESSDEEEEEWEARAILDERTIPNPDYRKPRANSHSSRSKSTIPVTIVQYLIDWEGVDPDTGKPWDPSWENGDGATQGLTDDWERRKKEDPEVVGRYTREQEERKRKSRRKNSGKPSSSQGREASKRTASSNTSKADVSSSAASPESPSGPVEKDEQPRQGSTSPAKSTLSDRPIRHSQASKRNIVVSPSTTASSRRCTQDETACTIEKGDSASKHDSRRNFASKGSKTTHESCKGKGRETSVSRLQDKGKQMSTTSPKSVELEPQSRKRRKVLLDTDDETEPPTITARTTSSRTGSLVRDNNRRQAKKQKTSHDQSETQGSRREDKGSRSSAKSTVRNPGSGETLIAIRAQRELSKTRDTDARVVTPDASSLRKKKKQSSIEPSTKEAKEAWKTSVMFNHSQATNSPSIVGDSQPPLTSSAESRISRQTPSQRTPPDLAQSTDVGRFAISDAMNQASSGSPKGTGQDSASPLVSAEAGPSSKPEPPTAAPMELDQEFVPNSLFAVDDDGLPDEQSPDIPQSQAVALQRAIDLLMMEENFLEEEIAKQGQTPEPAPTGPSIVTEKPAPIDPPRDNEVARTSEAVSDNSTSAIQAKEPSKRAPRKPFSAVDDFVAPAPPAPSAKQTQSAPDQPPVFKQPLPPRELHPIPHLAPAVFRNVGISGTPESFVNTQADSIHDFESPHRITAAETTAGPSTETTMFDSEKVAAVDAAVQTPVVVEQTTTEMIITEDQPAPMDDEEESQLPELGEDDWSRILDTATINPSVFGKPPGVVDDEDTTSSEETSHRSDENLAPRAVVNNDALLEAQAKIQALESDLAKVQSEKQQLEEHVDILKADLQEATTSQQNSQSQFSLIQDLYNQASATTMRLSRENEELEEEAERLRKQVSTGLKQKDLFMQSIVDAKDREIAELKARNEMLMAQAERMDAVRGQLTEMRQVRADLRYAEAQMALCAECTRRTTQTFNDSDPEYRPAKIIVPDNNDRSTRSRAKREEPVQVKAVEKPVVPKPILHAPEQRPESEEARKKLPLTDLARWAHDRDIRSVPEPIPEENLGADVADVDMVHICRWRPKHGNVCSALFANVEVS
ncbi:hypothetical protein NCC49_001597 [Naganishia albida]|nr:hypothetical protein NCC49_001597 [Naganishia albida]